MEELSTFHAQLWGWGGAGVITEQKHMDPEWLSQAQDKHLTRVVQRLSSYTPFMY